MIDFILIGSMLNAALLVVWWIDIASQQRELELELFDSSKFLWKFNAARTYISRRPYRTHAQLRARLKGAKGAIHADL